jgi:beta-ureidopropionase / N-carbamoyl-L-amino-acid hydrolase
VTQHPSFDTLWRELEPIGRHPATGGYRRYAWTPADLQCREWFTGAAAARGLDVETDRNGNLWAWWGDPSADDALVLGSHLDSVPDGGAFDGPLGVVSAFAAVDAARAAGHRPTRPVAVAAFSDEEGARFGVACGGSRLMTGVLDAGRARGLVDGDGMTMAEAMTTAGHDPSQVGPDPERIARIGCFIELHVEQGRVRIETAEGPAFGLIDLDRPVAVASSIWPHGRWRFDFVGRADHAGTTRFDDRLDPMLRFAQTVSAARDLATDLDVLATFGKVRVEPNGVNAIPSRVTAWLDARGADEDQVRSLVDGLSGNWVAVAPLTGSTFSSDRGGLTVAEESWTDLTTFDVTLRDQLAGILDDAPVLPTGAGHDAGILAAAGVPSAMLFVRNPTGVSHSPEEFAEADDCHAGVEALTTVLIELTTT